MKSLFALILLLATFSAVDAHAKTFTYKCSTKVDSFKLKAANVKLTIDAATPVGFLVADVTTGGPAGFPDSSVTYSGYPVKTQTKTNTGYTLNRVTLLVDSTSMEKDTVFVMSFEDELDGTKVPTQLINCTIQK
jgi:hypothetical protein